MASLMPNGKQTYTDSNGNPLAGGKLYTYAAGTSTPLETYVDAAGTTPNENPITLDARGEASVFWDSATYKVVLKDAALVEIYTQDNLAPVLSGALPEIASYASLRAYTGPITAYYVRGVATLFDGGAGVFRVDSADTTSADNGGTILVDAAGRRWRREFSGAVNVLWFGADRSGVTDSAAKVQAALEVATTIPTDVYGPSGDYLIGGAAYINVKPNVTLYGDGAGTHFISGAGGKTANHELVYLKDGAGIRDCRLSGSGYLGRSGSGNNAWNKIAITTQGAASGVGFRVKNVGLEKFNHSNVYVHDGHSRAWIEGCYTFGQQTGQYVDFDSVSGAVSNWNATQDAGKLAAGTQAYCLTNFYNTGGTTGASDVTICDNKLTNVNDAFVGVNGSSKRHKIYGNEFVKDTLGYFGGWGLDIYGGDDIQAWGNKIAGASYGAHLYGSTGCTIWGNSFETTRGVWIEASSSDNIVGLNNISLSVFSGLPTEYIGINVQTASNNELFCNTIRGNSIAAAKGVYFQGSTSGNRSVFDKVKDCVTGVESADVNNDGNFAYQPRFSGVTTSYPRTINSNHFQAVKGISGTSINANNLSGATNIGNTDTSVAVAFVNAEPDTNYRIVVSVTGASGTPAAGAYTITGVTSKLTTGFTLNIAAAPGAGNQVNFNWLLVR